MSGAEYSESNQRYSNEENSELSGLSDGQR